LIVSSESRLYVRTSMRSRRHVLPPQDLGRARLSADATDLPQARRDHPRPRVLSFLALLLKNALEDRIAALGLSGSWPEIIADLDSLTETEIEYDGKRFIVRSAPRPAASMALRAAGVALPPTVRDAVAS
jgi:hypothetical protein